MKQRFIEIKGIFSWFRLSLFRIREKTKLGNPLFRHLWTWTKWERYEYEEDEPNRILAFAYRIFPYPNTSQLIDIAVESTNEDEIKGACRLLFALEYKGQEFRSELIKKLEHSSDRLTLKRCNLIFEYANLTNQGNLRDIMNKTNDEISEDLEFYQNLHQRTVRIKERITAANNG